MSTVFLLFYITGFNEILYLNNPHEGLFAISYAHSELKIDHCYDFFDSKHIRKMRFFFYRYSASYGFGVYFRGWYALKRELF